MNKLILIICCFIIVSSCKEQVKSDAKYNSAIKHLIFSNQSLTTTFNRNFDLNDSTYKAYMVLISRRYRYVRVTIRGLISKDEITESPSSYFIYKSKIFLCYDGSEVIDVNHQVDSSFMNRLKNRMLDGGVINDSRVFQFDIDCNKKVKLNVPAINPYDFDLDKMKVVHFPPANKNQ